MCPHLLRMAVCGLAVSLSSAALAQWSSDPANNLKIADAPGDQVQPKVRATVDGGCYVSWFDSIALGWDVRLQRLDAAGNELWGHNGILVADRALSSTQDYDLIVDGSGNAVIAYNDDGGVSGAAQQVAVQKVDPSGTLLWGADGVTVSSGAAFKGPPHVALLSDGNFVVAYSDASTSPQSWRMQKLDATGAALWAGTGIGVAEAGHWISASDIQQGDNGSFIVLWIRSFNTSSLSSKYLLAMKYDGAGNPLWTPTTVASTLGPVTGVVVYMPDPGSSYTYDGGSGTYSATQGGSIQNGYAPTFLPDGAGGAVFGWYENAGPRNAYMQHILTDGTLKFPINGVSNAFTALSPGRIRLGASLAYDAATVSYYLASPESANPTQGTYSVLVQKFDTTGTRLWGNTGVTLQAPGSAGQPSFVTCLAYGDGAITSWLDTRSATTRVVDAARANGDQSVSWHTLVNSDASSDKSRLTGAMSTGGFAVLAYGWGSSGSVDVAAARLNSDGTQGNAVCYANCDGSTAAPTLNVADFTCFLQRYASGDSFANCDGSTATPTLNVADFTCFLQKYAAGCP
jgi:hypothetical protein